MHAHFTPKTAKTAGPPRLFWVALTIAVGLFTLALSLWAIRGILSQRLWVPLGWRRGLVLTDTAATLGGAAILCGAVAYVSYAGLRVLDGWEITADRITWYGCVGGLVLAIAAFVVNAL
ncbi:MAG: hypothetical protein AMXMBFR47_16180 [Planctomycetota bacterium]